METFQFFDEAHLKVLQTIEYLLCQRLVVNQAIVPFTLETFGLETVLKSRWMQHDYEYPHGFSPYNLYIVERSRDQILKFNAINAFKRCVSIKN